MNTSKSIADYLALNSTHKNMEELMQVGVLGAWILGNGPDCTLFV